MSWMRGHRDRQGLGTDRPRQVRASSAALSGRPRTFVRVSGVATATARVLRGVRVCGYADPRLDLAAQAALISQECGRQLSVEQLTSSFLLRARFVPLVVSPKARAWSPKARVKVAENRPARSRASALPEPVEVTIWPSPAAPTCP